MALATLATGSTLVGYVRVPVLSEPIPGVHAANRSAGPWAHDYLLLVVLLASLPLALVLLWQPTRGLVGLSFGAGALLTGGSLGLRGPCASSGSNSNAGREVAPATPISSRRASTPAHIRTP